MARRKKTPVVIVDENIPSAYVVVLPISSKRLGVTMRPGEVVTRDGFLAGNSDDDINLYLRKGVLRVAKDVGLDEVKDG